MKLLAPALLVTGSLLTSCASTDGHSKVKDAVSAQKPLELTAEQMVECSAGDAAGCGLVGATRLTVACMITVGEKHFRSAHAADDEPVCPIVMRLRNQLCADGIEAGDKLAACLQVPLPPNPPPPLDPFGIPGQLPALYHCRGDQFDQPGGVDLVVRQSTSVDSPLSVSLTRLDGSNIRGGIDSVASMVPDGVEILLTEFRPDRILLTKPTRDASFQGVYSLGDMRFPLTCDFSN
jgi:hypothetical protein